MRMRVGLHLGFAIAAALAAVNVGTGTAEAQTCYTLQAELTHLQSQPNLGDGGRARYERAWREQARVLANTEAAARRAHCFGGGFLFFRADPEPVCRVLVPKLNRMEENLAKLDRLRLTGDGGNLQRMRKLQRMIAARNCGPNGEEADNSPPDGWVYQGDTASPGPGTYRTMCVRTCDGYYFPISFSTTQDRFDEDAATCASRCPGADAKLFYYPNPGGTTADMVSLDGEAYSSLPTAFQYRTKMDASCTCQGETPDMSPVPEPDARPSVEAEAQPDTAPSAAPQSRPDPGEDPETLADRAGSYDPHAAQPEATPLAPATKDGHPVRVVGPSYLGSASENEVMLKPVPN